MPVLHKNRNLSDNEYSHQNEPTSEEINEYAKHIGIDLETEQNLMHIAHDGISYPLPDNWNPIFQESGKLYYFNSTTSQCTWEHPCDEYYRNLVTKERETPPYQNGIPSYNSELNETRHMSDRSSKPRITKKLPPLNYKAGKTNSHELTPREHVNSPVFQKPTTINARLNLEAMETSVSHDKARQNSRLVIHPQEQYKEASLSVSEALTPVTSFSSPNASNSFVILERAKDVDDGPQNYISNWEVPRIILPSSKNASENSVTSPASDGIVAAQDYRSHMSNEYYHVCEEGEIVFTEQPSTYNVSKLPSARSTPKSFYSTRLSEVLPTNYAELVGQLKKDPKIKDRRDEIIDKLIASKDILPSDTNNLLSWSQRPTTKTDDQYTNNALHQTEYKLNTLVDQMTTLIKCVSDKVPMSEDKGRDKIKSQQLHTCSINSECGFASLDKGPKIKPKVCKNTCGNYAGDIFADNSVESSQPRDECVSLNNFYETYAQPRISSALFGKIPGGHRTSYDNRIPMTMLKSYDQAERSLEERIQKYMETRKPPTIRKNNVVSSSINKDLGNDLDSHRRWIAKVQHEILSHLNSPR